MNQTKLFHAKETNIPRVSGTVKGGIEKSRGSLILQLLWLDYPLS